MTRASIGSTLGRIPPRTRDVEPALVLILLPMAIGALAEIAFRDARRASLAAAVGAVLAVAIAVQALGRDESWSWVAAMLVSPLSIALAIATVLFWYGRTTKRVRRHGA